MYRGQRSLDHLLHACARFEAESKQQLLAQIGIDGPCSLHAILFEPIPGILAARSRARGMCFALLAPIEPLHRALCVSGFGVRWLPLPLANWYRVSAQSDRHFDVRYHRSSQV